MYPYLVLIYIKLYDFTDVFEEKDFLISFKVIDNINYL